ncbi:MAG: NAD(P)/FAD-dependent oxidoreductase [Pyrinomonadaceae bacterium]
MEEFDVIIIGAGAAGISAAFWCNELGLKTVVLEESDSVGGQLNYVYNPIENHLGANFKSGKDFILGIKSQIEARKPDLRFNSKVTELDFSSRTVVSNSQRLSYEFLIIATGIRRRTLGLQGELEFAGAGIIESGAASAYRFDGKRVVIVGGGDAAFENALIFSEHAQSIFIINRTENFRARAEFQKLVKNEPKINVLANSVVREIYGGSNVNAVLIEDVSNGKLRKIETDGVLVRIGAVPNSELFLPSIAADETAYILTDKYFRTNEDRVFAIGDVSNPNAPTIATAEGSAAIAAKQIRVIYR